MNKKNIYLFIIIIIILVIFSFLMIKNIKLESYFSKTSQNNTANQVLPKNLNKNKINYVKITGQILKTELATTPEAQERGLSGRKELKEDESMLFVFSKPSVRYFWMKEMNFPIDMIWIGENMQVIFIEKNVKPESYPKTFGPKQDSKYVLEISANFSEKNNLKVGEKVEFLP